MSVCLSVIVSILRLVRRRKIPVNSYIFTNHAGSTSEGNAFSRVCLIIGGGGRSLVNKALSQSASSTLPGR